MSTSSAAPKNWWPKNIHVTGYFYVNRCYVCSGPVVLGSTYTDGIWQHGRLQGDSNGSTPGIVYTVIGIEADHEVVLGHGPNFEYRFYKDRKHPKWNPDGTAKEGWLPSWTADNIPEELLAIVSKAAGKSHKSGGEVAQNLADVLNAYDAIKSKEK